MKTIINIEGMTCSYCEKSVTRILSDIKGVKNAEVSLECANAVVEYENAHIEDIIEEFNDSNFQASLEDSF